jgi:hypothetical protein
VEATAAEDEVLLRRLPAIAEEILPQQMPKTKNTVASVKIVATEALPSWDTRATGI